ncbi:HIT family protein [Candidatus Woesearchaeota archaeon]|nr:HIT family protein [Candidatus Woesearchaeota archaeon]
MNCIECEMLRQRKNLIYEDEYSAAFLYDKPAAAGHIVVFPKQHHPIIENIPDDIMSSLFLAVNKISMTCFDVFKAHGTNILIRNGLAAGQKTTHAAIHIIPRFENDGLNLQWTPLKFTDDEMTTAELSLKAEIEKETSEHYKIQAQTEKEEIAKQERLQPKEEIPEEENYMLKQLDRMP